MNGRTFSYDKSPPIAQYMLQASAQAQATCCTPDVACAVCTAKKQRDRTIKTQAPDIDRFLGYTWN